MICLTAKTSQSKSKEKDFSLRFGKTLIKILEVVCKCVEVTPKFTAAHCILQNKKKTKENNLPNRYKESLAPLLKRKFLRSQKQQNSEKHPCGSSQGTKREPSYLLHRNFSKHKSNDSSPKTAL